MKKFISMLVVVAMICSLSITAFAAPTAIFADKEVEAGTTDVTVNLELKFVETTGVYAMSMMFVAEGATITAVDTSAIDAVIPKSSMSDAATFYYTWMDDQATTYNYDFAAGSYIVPVTVKLDSAEAGATATVGLDAVSSMIMEGNTGNPLEVTFPTATITVAAAGPKYELGAPVDEVAETALDADTTSIEGFTNYAIYTHKFEALELNAAEGEKVNHFGFKADDREYGKTETVINGSVTCVLAIAGKVDAVVKPFYNVTRLVEVQ